MIRGSVRFKIARDTYTAFLLDAGWSCPDLPVLAKVLNSQFGLDRYGPADGDPFVIAVNEAAEFLDGVPNTLPGTATGRHGRLDREQTEPS